MAEEELPLPYRIQQAVRDLKYEAGDASGKDYKSSRRKLGKNSFLLLIFKPLSGWRRLLPLEPYCIGLLDISKDAWQLYIYGRDYNREMRDLAAILSDKFKVNIEAMLRSEKPRNWQDLPLPE